MNKEVSDALHMLLHCALKDKEYETQKEQFEIIYKHIEELHNKIDKAIEYIKKYQQIYDIDGSIEKHLDEFNILASPKRLLEILKDSDVDD